MFEKVFMFNGQWGPLKKGTSFIHRVFPCISHWHGRVPKDSNNFGLSMILDNEQRRVDARSLKGLQNHHKLKRKTTPGHLVITFYPPGNKHGNHKTVSGKCLSYQRFTISGFHVGFPWCNAGKTTATLRLHSFAAVAPCCELAG